MNLLDACELIVDCPHSTAKDEGNGFPLIRTPNIGKGRLMLDGVHRVCEEVYNQRNARAIPQTGDLILAREAPVGNVAVIQEGQKVCLGQRTVLIRPKKTSVDSNFLVYYLLSPRMQNLLLRSANGATVSHLNMADIRKLNIELPQLEEQKKIGRLLAVIDDLIDTNSGINRNLYDQLDAIYTDLFIGECNGVLSDICDYAKAKVEVSALSEETYYSTENMLPNKAGSKNASNLPTSGTTQACSKGNVLISNIRPYFKKIAYCYGDSGCSSDVLCFVAKKPCLAPYIFSTLYTDKFFNYMVAGSKGTKMPRGDKQQIMQYPIHIPEEEQLSKFCSMAKNIHDMIHANNGEKKCLETIRDILLPKLMSGELDVSGLDI